MKRQITRSFLPLFLIINVVCLSQTSKYAGPLDEANMVQILTDCNCPLVKVYGAKGIELVRKNLRAQSLIDGKELGHGRAGAAMCSSLNTDLGKKSNGKLNVNNLLLTSTSLREFQKQLYKACVPKEFHNKDIFDHKIYPAYKKDAERLLPVMTKLFIEEHTCTEAGIHHRDGNFLLTVFRNRLFEISDYIFDGIERELGQEHQITLNDITNQDNRNYIREEFCRTLCAGAKINKERMEHYLNKFYGSSDCGCN